MRRDAALARSLALIIAAIESGGPDALLRRRAKLRDMAARVHRRLDLRQRAGHRCDEEERAQEAASRYASDGDLIHGRTLIFESLATSGIAAEVPGFLCHGPGDDADRSHALTLNVYRYALGKGRAAGPPFRHDRR